MQSLATVLNLKMLNFAVGYTLSEIHLPLRRLGKLAKAASDKTLLFRCLGLGFHLAN